MAESKATRSITILKDNEKLFVLSESALKRLSASNVDHKENEYEISPQQQLQPQQQYKFEKLNNEITDLREKNDILWKAANGRLLSDVNKVQSNQLKFKHEKVCVDIESKLNDCYMRNSSKPLLCSSLAKEFWSCVNSKKQIN